MPEFTVTDLFKAADATGMRAGAMLCAILCTSNHVHHRDAKGGAQVP